MFQKYLLRLMYLKKKKGNSIYNVINHALLNSLKIFNSTISSTSSHHNKYPITVHMTYVPAFSNKQNMYNARNFRIKWHIELSICKLRAGLGSINTFAFYFSSCYQRWPLSLLYEGGDPPKNRIYL